MYNMPFVFVLAVEYLFERDVVSWYLMGPVASTRSLPEREASVSIGTNIGDCLSQNSMEAEQRHEMRSEATNHVRHGYEPVGGIVKPGQ